MDFIFHRYWLISVHRQGDMLVATIRYMDTCYEMTGIMRVGIADYKVIEAIVQTYRAPKATGHAGMVRLDGMVGLKAYTGAGHELRRVVADDPTGRWADIFLEGVKGLFQAEYAVCKERGFSSLVEYQTWFGQNFGGTCVYHSHPGQASQTFIEHTNDQVRDQCSFNRHRYCSISGQGGEYLIQAGLSDSFHELGVALRVDGASADIRQADGRTLRAVDTICWRGLERISLLPGIPLRTANRKQLLQAVGGSEGCTHLADLVLEGAKTLELAVDYSSQKGGSLGSKVYTRNEEA